MPGAAVSARLISAALARRSLQDAVHTENHFGRLRRRLEHLALDDESLNDADALHVSDTAAAGHVESVSVLPGRMKSTQLTHQLRRVETGVISDDCWKL